MDNLTAVIPFRNGHSTIGRLLDSLPRDLPVIIIDDMSDEPHLSRNAQLSTWENIRVIRLDQRGYFSGAINVGIAACDTDVLILNQDVWLEGTDWQDPILNNRDEFAIIGDGVMNHPAHPRGYCQGTFLFLRRDAIGRVGNFDERDYPLWGATALWQVQACRMGYKALPTKIPGLCHARQGDYGSAIAAALKDEPEKRRLFIRTPPAISVIITAHNYGRFLADAVNSLMGGISFLGEMKPQAFQSFEIVLVDYGSDDDTGQICDALADGWKGIHAIHVPDEGTAEACNAGIRASHGKYLAMLDADDAMETERLELLYRAAVANPHAVVCDDIRICQFGERREWWNFPPYDFEKLLEKNVMHKGLLFPREAWEEVGGYPRVMTDGREDWAFHIALGVKGWCGVHVPQPLYLARRGEHNRSNRNTTPLWHQRFIEKLHYLFPEIYGGARPMGCCGGNRGQRRGGTRAHPVAPGRALGAAHKDGALPGEKGGLILLEYTLPDYADLRAYHGKATATAYWFGKLRRQGYVDARDLDGFLSFMGGKAFQVWTPPMEAKEVKVKGTGTYTIPEGTKIYDSGGYDDKWTTIEEKHGN